MIFVVIQYHLLTLLLLFICCYSLVFSIRYSLLMTLVDVRSRSFWVRFGTVRFRSFTVTFCTVCVCRFCVFITCRASLHFCAYTFTPHLVCVAYHTFLGRHLCLPLPFWFHTSLFYDLGGSGDFHLPCTLCAVYALSFTVFVSLAGSGLGWFLGPDAFSFLASHLDHVPHVLRSTVLPRLPPSIVTFISFDRCSRCLLLFDFIHVVGTIVVVVVDRWHC